VLPRQFLDAFDSGHFNQVPVINGATLDEATLLIWLSHNFRLKPLREEQYLPRLEYLTGSPELAQQVARQYPLEAYPSAYDALTEAFSDGFFNCIARRQGLALSRHVPTWSYQFDSRGAPFFIPWADLRAFHSAEIQYVMGRPMSLFRRDFPDSESGLADSMMSYWVRFAQTGNPNGAGYKDWPVYDAEGDLTMLFDLENSVAEEVHKQDCTFWQDLPYLRPAYTKEQFEHVSADRPPGEGGPET
jgi:para-nitrobenzyl esterase